MQRAYYDASIHEFLAATDNEILGELTRHHDLALEHRQRNAWLEEIRHVRGIFVPSDEGHILFEFAIPRMGRRADVVLLLGDFVIVVEYKVGATAYHSQDIDQAVDYALDLKNFHGGSHDLPIVPILVATDAPDRATSVSWGDDLVAKALLVNRAMLGPTLRQLTDKKRSPINASAWLAAPYKPTPTIVEAAKALYHGHSVEEISRSDAGAINLSKTARVVSKAIESAKADGRKVICFVTGVPGSGKTLAGLNLATERMRVDEGEHAVFLSGNGPLVEVLREALARDEVEGAKSRGDKLVKTTARRRVEAFIQNIHHFRDEALRVTGPPVERVAIFDEAQRAWTKEQTSRFMREKRGLPSFNVSEPEFLLSVMDRHPDWCAVVCLVGGGQEINTGEGGLAEWFRALAGPYRHWRVACSDQLPQADAALGADLGSLLQAVEPHTDQDLHLGVSVRSFRSEAVAAFVEAVIEGNADRARDIHHSLERYPIVLTRELDRARAWLRENARGSERYGLVASANSLRLKPIGIHVKSTIDVAAWFLNPKGDVRASFALEDAASEFDIQGLELDWVGVCWDANFRYSAGSWGLHRFKGTTWQAMNASFGRAYLANAYRVLLTRARQGMVIFVPYGDDDDPTRKPEFYDGTFALLRRCGIPVID